jgi:hypothetical protein
MPLQEAGRDREEGIEWVQVPLAPGNTPAPAVGIHRVLS